MANDIRVPAGTGPTIITDDIAGSHAQGVKLLVGIVGDRSLAPGDVANGIDVDVTRFPGLAPSTNNIGDVDVLTLPAIPAGNNNIGDVDVVTLPALPAGNNNIGDVDVLTLPALPAGTNAIGKLAANSGVDIGDVDVTSLPNSVAHDAVVVASVAQIGLNARTTDPTPVQNNDATRMLADTLGKGIVLVGATNDQQLNGRGTFSTTTAADVIAAQGAGQRIAVMSILVTSAHLTVSSKVEIRDGTTVKVQGYAAADGGGFTLVGGGTPIFVGTANTAITARCVTTGADIDVFISGYKLAN